MANSPFIFGANGATSLVPGGVTLPASTSGTIQIEPAAVTTSYAVLMPPAQASGTQILQNDGSGNLSWVTSTSPAAGSDGQVLKSMNSVFINSSYYTPYINYVGNAFSETNTNGWATYSNTAQNIPVNGTGGTATGLTFSRSTSSPLRDTGTFSIVQTNSTNLQGKGVSYAFTIDAADQAKVLSIQLDYNASSTFVAGNGTTAPLNDGTTTTNAGNSDIEVFIYDVTNAILIPVSPEVFTANGTNNFTFKGVFQTASNSTSYRFILHCATNNANATGYTFKFTNVFVGPQYLIQGSPVTDWIAYTPTFVGLGTPSAVSFYSRRAGDSLQVRGIYTQGVATAVAGQLSLGYNGGNANVTIDSSKVSSTMVCGMAALNINSATEYTMLMVGGNSYIVMGAQAAGTAGLSPLIGGVGTGTVVSFFAEVPISGWASNILMSNDADIRVISARMTGATATVTSSYSDVTWTTIVNDTTGSMGAINYTVGSSGYFDVAGSIYASATTITAGQLFAISLFNTTTSTLIEEFTYIYQGTNTTSTSIPFNFRSVLFTSGTQFKIQVKSSTTAPVITSSATENYLSISKQLGPSQVATIDSVNARYFASATSISASLATISWTTKDYDSHSGMASGVYTVPISGKYQINSAILVTGTIALNSSLIMEIQKNGTVVSRYTLFSGGIETDLKGIITDQLNCIGGDLLKIQVSTSITGPSIVSSNFDNYISLFRTGN